MNERKQLDKAPLVDCRHGHRREDPWAWLRDPDWREAMADPQRLHPEIRSWLEAENRHTERVLGPLQPLHEQLVAELRGRLAEDDRGVPLPDGPWAYYWRFRPGGEHPLICRRPRADDDDRREQILLDADARAKGAGYYDLAAWGHSPDHRYLAFSEDRSGAEKLQIRFLDTVTGELLPDCLENVRGDFEWAADSRTLLWIEGDEEHRPRRVRRHRLGEDAGGDRPGPVVYEEADAGFFLSLGRTQSGRFLLIDCHGHGSNEQWVIPAGDPDQPPRCLIPRAPEQEYAALDHGDRWILLTNHDAEDFRIVAAPLEAAGDTGRWTDLVPHRPGRLIRDLHVLQDWLIWGEMADAQPAIYYRRWAGGETARLDFGAEPCDLGLVAGYEYRTDTLRTVWSSLTTPTEVHDHDLRDGRRTLRKRQPIPSGHDPAAYTAIRTYATAPDGERVPLSVVHRADLHPDAATPLLLYAYGAYGITSEAGFSPHRLSLLDRGFVYAIAHVRGGKERGQRWYREGRREHKPNTFSDTVACAEALIEQGYTGPGRLALFGGSAGGLLVGAVLNQRPELFHAAVAAVPFVDVLNTMLDPSLPLTPPEWPEWGNPLEDEAAYHRIRGWSPYDNVAPRPYPHLLVTAGVSDPRVTYWEPAKWVARLREVWPGDRLLLLDTNMSAGHGGPGGRFEYLQEVARRYTFLLHAYGLAQQGFTGDNSSQDD